MAGSGGILVYALHDDEGNFNNNSLGAISEAAKLAGELGSEAAALVVGEVADDAAAGLGSYGATRVFRAKSVPEGLAQPIVDAMAKVIADEGFSYALFGGGLLGFEIGAGLTARLNAGVTMEVTAVKVADGKLVSERPVLQDSAIVDVGYVGEPGIIIGRLNAFDVSEGGGGGPRSSTWRSSSRIGRRGPGCASAASSGGRTSTSKTPTSSSAAAAGSARRTTSRSPRTSPMRSAAPSRRRAPWSTRAGTRMRRRSARPGRPWRRSSTSRPGSRVLSSTRSGCRARRASSRSTRTRTRRSSSSAISGLSAICTRSSRS